MCNRKNKEWHFQFARSITCMIMPTLYFIGEQEKVAYKSVLENVI